MNRFSLFTRQALALVLIFLLSACAEEPLGGNDPTGKGYTVTLRLSATLTPIPETKATAIPARAGSEAEAAGFKYEMVSSDAVTKTPGFTVEMESSRPDSVVISLGTKAPGTLKNVYAFLFTSDGAFNGRADIGAFTSGVAAYIDFVNVKTTAAKNCRLVVVANDAGAATSYSSSTNFVSFSGSYAEFQKLTITNEIKEDEDVPYAGSAIIEQSLSESGVTADVPLCRTLVKVTFNNHTFDITGGPKRSSITLYNAGVRRFATQGNDDYEGTGSTQTIDVVANTSSDNSNSVTWYVGENIQPAVASVQTPADRNSSKAPVKACYIRVASAALPVVNKSPKVGEEYIESGTKSFTYDYYLGRSSDMTDFALRRHTNYTLNSEISGTLAGQEELAAEDGRVTLTRPEPAGLAIGYFGEPVGYTPGAVALPDITGSYKNMLLLEPNTSRTTAQDNIRKVWGEEGIESPMDTRRYWDWKYIYGVKTGGTVGGMSTAADGLYAYCNKLTLGGVPEGTWYVPTIAQHYAIHTVLAGLKEGYFGNYSALFDAANYWTCTVYDKNQAWYAIYNSNEPGAAWYKGSKTQSRYVRCVRDAPAPASTSPYVTEIGGHPVIDLSELSPLGCLLTPAEAAARCEEINSQTPSNTAFLPIGIEVTGEKGRWNAKMSPRFQLMRANLLTGTDWATAYTGCKQYEGEGGKPGQWRLPTQRELKMIWLLHPQLSGKGGVTPFTGDYYFACNEHIPGRAWYTSFSYPSTTPNREKVEPFHVRCVRDLE